MGLQCSDAQRNTSIDGCQVTLNLTLDKKTLKRISLLIKLAMRDPEDGIGKAESLKENLSGL